MKIYPRYGFVNVVNFTNSIVVVQNPSRFHVVGKITNVVQPLKSSNHEFEMSENIIFLCPFYVVGNFFLWSSV